METESFEPSEEIATFSNQSEASATDGTSEATTSTEIGTESVFDTNEQISPEFLQRKLYFLLEHLKKMHGELPE